MALMNSELADYRGEFRYVFYAVDGRYEETLGFYSRVLDFPVVGGFGDNRSGVRGVYLKAPVGLIKLIDSEPSDLRDMLMSPDQEHRPPAGGFLLIEVEDVDGLAERVAKRGVAFM